MFNDIINAKIIFVGAVVGNLIHLLWAASVGAHSVDGLLSLNWSAALYGVFFVFLYSISFDWARECLRKCVTVLMSRAIAYKIANPRRSANRLFIPLFIHAFILYLKRSYLGAIFIIACGLLIWSTSGDPLAFIFFLAPIAAFVSIFLYVLATPESFFQSQGKAISATDGTTDPDSERRVVDNFWNLVAEKYSGGAIKAGDIPVDAVFFALICGFFVFPSVPQVLGGGHPLRMNIHLAEQHFSDSLGVNILRDIQMLPFGSDFAVFFDASGSVFSIQKNEISRIDYINPLKGGAWGFGKSFCGTAYSKVGENFLLLSCK